MFTEKFNADNMHLASMHFVSCLASLERLSSELRTFRL